MSQEQPKRPEAHDDHDHQQDQPIKYGDVLHVQGNLAGQGVAPRDAAMMQSAENRVFGYIEKDGPTSVIQSAADKNERAGFVGHDQVTGAVNEHGVAITEIDLPGKRMIAESIGGQVIGQDGDRGPLVPPSTMGAGKHNNITIGEALEATALTAGNRPVDYSDAAAIQAAEVRATCRTCIVPGGVAAAAQSAATRNARATRDEDKTKLAEILADASTKLPADKPVTRRDAEGVIGAEIRNDPNLCTRPGGVAASLAAAARLNQSNNSQQANNQNN